jgi:hypothetical protein
MIDLSLDFADIRLYEIPKDTEESTIKQVLESFIDLDRDTKVSQGDEGFSYIWREESEHIFENSWITFQNSRKKEIKVKLSSPEVIVVTNHLEALNGARLLARISAFDAEDDEEALISDFYQKSIPIRKVRIHLTNPIFRNLLNNQSFTDTVLDFSMVFDHLSPLRDMSISSSRYTSKNLLNKFLDLCQVNDGYIESVRVSISFNAGEKVSHSALILSQQGGINLVATSDLIESPIEAVVSIIAFLQEYKLLKTG